ncbi:translation initiation factor [Babesia ovis]|uniref:Translation initiation factor n=1 Tax=Babesia ovis TaxID=5869 RepID=A0A9W5WUF3_BABOV|nr:translation initiation factor [Babesia ovis]
MIAASRWLLYRGKFLPLGRAAFRKTLSRGRSQRSPEILLPPWVAIHELRLMLRANYSSCLRACGVSITRGTYTWNDVEGRRFRTDNKRHVLVPFESAAVASRDCGYHAIRVSPEPESPKRCVDSRAIPVVAIVGHKDHGKTSLMERLCGESITRHEPGNTTQQVVIRPALLPTENGSLDVTLLDTPGDGLFEILRGRALHLADIALVVISSEGGEAQTRDLIIQADRFRVPVVFCINKSDLEFRDVEVARAELRSQCYRMYRTGLISSDMATSVQDAVAISALTGASLPQLGSAIKRRVTNMLPHNPVVIPKYFGGVPLTEVAPFLRRTNCLVSTGAPPIAACFILEVERTHSFGTVLTVIVRHGTLIQGAYFVAGTEYGRISAMHPPHGKIGSQGQIERATVGQAVRITGLKSIEGTSADDLLLTLPQHEAFRLSQYRWEVQLLRAQQIEGPPLDLPWSVLLKPMEDAGYNQDATTTEEMSHGDPLIVPLSNNCGDTESESEPNSPLSSIYLRPVDDTSADVVGNCPDSYKESADTDDIHEYDATTQWATTIAQRNRELHAKWQEKLRHVETPSPPKPHGITGQPQITPEMGRPVIPVILRANFVGSFDALLDGFELLERKYNVRIPVVHGGLGAVSPSDVVQADIGNKFGHCPVYAFQVPVLTDAAKHAVINHVVVKQFNVYSDLLADVEKRCERAIDRILAHKERNQLRL